MKSEFICKRMLLYAEVEILLIKFIKEEMAEVADAEDKGKS